MNKKDDYVASGFIKLDDAKNKRLVGVIVLLIVLLACSTIFNYYLLNDYVVVETTDVEDVDMDTNDGNNTYIGGDNNGEIKSEEN